MNVDLSKTTESAIETLTSAARATTEAVRGQLEGHDLPIIGEVFAAPRRSRLPWVALGVATATAGVTTWYVIGQRRTAHQTQSTEIASLVQDDDQSAALPSQHAAGEAATADSRT